VVTTLQKEEIVEILRSIPDPEIPVISIDELGILRDVVVIDDHVEVVITPTYSGCPAMKQIEEDIIAKLHEHGIDHVTVRMTYQPAWTTDWISDIAKEKLRQYGIAPPGTTQTTLVPLIAESIHCPHCGSVHIEEVSHFSSTACKALYRCLDCKEPFDYFKSI